jgi:hypothetical protein
MPGSRWRSRQRMGVLKGPGPGVECDEEKVMGDAYE